MTQSAVSLTCAVLQGFNGQGRYSLIKMPGSEDSALLWQLIQESNISLIVVLNQASITFLASFSLITHTFPRILPWNLSASQDDRDAYWPKEVGASQTVGPFSIVNSGNVLDAQRKNIHIRELTYRVDNNDTYVRSLIFVDELQTCSCFLCCDKNVFKMNFHVSIFSRESLFRLVESFFS